MARVAGIQKHVIGCDIEYKCKQFLVLFGQLAEKKNSSELQISEVSNPNRKVPLAFTVAAISFATPVDAAVVNRHLFRPW